MKVNIIDIPEEGLNLQFSLTEGSFPDLISEKEKLDFSLRRVDVSGSLRKVRQSIFFAGTLDVALEMFCSRCLEAVYLPLRTVFDYTLLPESATGKKEAELKLKDLETDHYSGEVIDLVPIVFEQIMLQIPMKALCKESCKGLCPHCGINLNTANCNCRDDLVDERLAVLKNFKV